MTRLAFTLLIAVPVLAQLPATLNLTIYDAAGLPIPGARITVSFSVSAISVGLISDQNGRAVVHVASGSYRVTAESAVAIQVSQLVNVSAGQVVNLALRLSQTPVPDVPLRPVDLLLRQAEIEPGEPGGFIEGAPPYGILGDQAVNTEGQRSQNNNFLIDGFDNIDIWTRAPALLLPSDSISQVTLSTGFIPAEFGHALGATLALPTKSGSDQLHWGLYDYFQNSYINSRNFFDAFQKPGQVSNQFGLSIGGRAHRGIYFFLNGEALRDRDQLTVVSTVPTTAEKSGVFNVPIYDPTTISTPDGVNYSRQPFPNNKIPLSRIPQSSQAVLALYPNPNLPGVANNFLYSPTAVDYDNQFLARTDVTLTPRNTFFIRYNMDDPYQLSPSALPGSASDYAQGAGDENIRTHSWSAAFSDAHIITLAISNTFRLGISSANLNVVSNDQGVNASTLLGVPGLTTAGLPSIEPTGYTELGAFGPAPLQIRTESAQVEDDVAWTTRKHAFHFGFQAIRRYADGNASSWTDRGTFIFTPDYTSQPATPTGNSIASLLLGYPDEVRSDTQLSEYHIRDWEWSGYVQDQLRLGRRLTLEAGIRYQYFPPVSEAHNQLVNFNFSHADPALTQFAGQSGVNDSAGLSALHFGFAPRAGFALNLGTARANPRTKLLGNPIGKMLADIFAGPWVLRGGFTTNFDTGAYMYQASLAQNPPYASRYDLINGEFALGSTLAQGLPPAVSIAPTTANLNASATPVYAIQRGDYTPYAEQWNLFLDHQILSRLAVEIGGIGSRGVHLFEAYNANQPAPGPYPFTAPREPYSPYDWPIDYFGFGGESSYWAGVAKLNGNIWHGIVLQLSYAYSKSIDDAATPAIDPQGRPDVPQNIGDPRANRAVSAFDVPQRAVLLGEYLIPFQQLMIANWRVDAQVTLQSGFPFTPQLATSTLNNGSYQLPDRVGSGALSSGRSYQEWFNTALTGPNAAFAIPPPYQYGDSGIDILRGPGLATVDLALARTFSLSRRLRLTLRLDAFNVLNRANFGLPDRILGVDDSGVIDHTITTARRFQLSVRVEW
jgi:hypothetical protein